MFYTLTPREYNDLVDGYYRRVRREREVTAAWVCTLVNHMPMRGKKAKTLRVEQLIGYSTEQIREMKAEAARKKSQAEATKDNP